MADLIGQEIGQYHVTKQLGKGGMGTVYRARQRNIERDVAIKVISAEYADIRDFTARFEREAKTLAALSHTHILKVFDYGRHQDGYYLVMELLNGGSLADLIDAKGPIPIPLAVRLTEQIASALDYAHQRSIIHRDLKPQNVLLDDASNALLTDFGLAKLLNANTALTSTGSSVGTPAYMAPEQWTGDTVDGRADIYSLGITLFEMLSGKLPFEGDTTYRMMYQHMYDYPRLLHPLNPSLPPEIDLIIAKSLAKRPEERFSAAGELAAAFRDLATGKPLVGLEGHARPPQVRVSDPRRAGDELRQLLMDGEPAAQDMSSRNPGLPPRPSAPDAPDLAGNPDIPSGPIARTATGAVGTMGGAAPVPAARPVPPPAPAPSLPPAPPAAPPPSQSVDRPFVDPLFEDPLAKADPSPAPGSRRGAASPAGKPGSQARKPSQGQNTALIAAVIVSLVIVSALLIQAVRRNQRNAASTDANATPALVVSTALVVTPTPLSQMPLSSTAQALAASASAEVALPTSLPTRTATNTRTITPTRTATPTRRPTNTRPPSRTPVPSAGGVTAITRIRTNLRAGPGMEHPVVLTVMAGERFRVEGKAYSGAVTWIAVTLRGGAPAWVLAINVNLDPPTAAIPIVTPRPPPPPQSPPAG